MQNWNHSGMDHSGFMTTFTTARISSDEWKTTTLSATQPTAIVSSYISNCYPSLESSLPHRHHHFQHRHKQPQNQLKNYQKMEQPTWLNNALLSAALSVSANSNAPITICVTP